MSVEAFTFIHDDGATASVMVDRATVESILRRGTMTINTSSGGTYVATVHGDLDRREIHVSPTVGSL